MPPNNPSPALPPPFYALTGNIGSGKSTVAALFGRLGIPVYEADAEAKRLMVSDPALVEAIRNRFGIMAHAGEGYLSPQGRLLGLSLNRAFLAARVFSQPEELAALNALVHPRVAADAEQWRQAQTAAYLLYEAAITLEIGAAGRFAGVIVVTAPQRQRLARVLLRNPELSTAQVNERMAQQWPDDRKAAAADFLIHNPGHLLLFPQVLALHHQLLQQQQKS